MPYFAPEDLEISPEEFFDSCSRKEKKELLEYLVEENIISKSAIVENNKTGISAPEQIFEEHLDILHGKWNRLSKEDEEIIMTIAKKFK